MRRDPTEPETVRTAPGGIRWFCAPLLVAAVVSLWRDWIPIADLALIEMQLGDMWVSPPLVGTYSRLHLNHPGPAMFWILWLPWWLVGGGGPGQMFATVLWHTAAAAISLRFAGRLGGRGLQVVTALTLATTAVVVQPDALVQPWNPYLNLTLVPALLLTWAGALRGDPAAQNWFVIVGSVMVQNHLGLIPPVAVLGGIWGLALVRDAVRHQQLSRLRLAVRPVAIGLALWALPIIEQVQNSPGNLRRVWEFANHSEGRVGMAAAARVLGRMLGPTPPWLGIRPPVDPFIGGMNPSFADWRTWPLLVAIPLAAWILGRRRRPDARAPGVLEAAGVLVACGFATIAGISGLPHEYLVAWVSVACAFWVFAGAHALAVGAWVPNPAPPTARSPIAPGLLGSALALSIIFAPTPHEAYQPAVRALSRQILAELGPRVGVVDFDAALDRYGNVIVSAVATQLERAGWRTFLPTASASLGVSGPRVATDRPPDRVILAVASEDTNDRFRADPRWRVLTTYQPFSPAERQRIQELEAQLAGLSSAPGPDVKVLRFYTVRALSDLRANRNELTVYRRQP